MGVTLAAIITLATTGSAQQPRTSGPLDVVSIKPSPPGPPQAGPMAISPGRVELRGTTLKALIRQAYSRFPFDPRQAVGGPSWIDTDRFDVIATLQRPLQAAPNGMPTELFAMIRAIVEERFQVKTHNEQRQADVYALVLARSDGKTGAGLRAVPDACGAAIKELVEGKPAPPRQGPPPCSFGGPPGRLIGTGVAMSMFANVLSGSVGRAVLDRTGLKGSYDIELTFDPSSAAQAPPGAPLGPTPVDDTKPSIFTALQEQLGLKLESTRGPIDVLVIDQAQRPAPN